MGTSAVPAGLAIRLSGVRKRFGAVEALRGADLAVRPGEIVAYVGPNGAGRTTTVDLVLGLSRQSAGTVEVVGVAPEQAVRKGLVAAVGQNGGLLKDLTVLETVRYVSTLYPYGATVATALERAGIAGTANRMVGKCSGGEEQRLRLAMALLAEPDLLVLDEPTQAMDVEGRRDFCAGIREDTAGGRTILVSRRDALPRRGGQLRRTGGAHPPSCSSPSEAASSFRCASSRQHPRHREVDAPVRPQPARARPVARRPRRLDLGGKPRWLARHLHGRRALAFPSGHRPDLIADAPPGSRCRHVAAGSPEVPTASPDRSRRPVS